MSFRSILVERLAAIEHEQWIAWATTILESEDISPERAERWRGYMVPYDQLDEATKEHDRVWARKAIDALESSVTVEVGSLPR